MVSKLYALKTETTSNSFLFMGTVLPARDIKLHASKFSCVRTIVSSVPHEALHGSSAVVSEDTIAMHVVLRSRTFIPILFST